MAQSTVYKPAKPIDKNLDSKLIEKAYSFAVECHKSQKGIQVILIYLTQLQLQIFY